VKTPADKCPDAERLHTKDPTEPAGYVAWHEWAEWMAKRSRQRQCPTCGRWAIWAPTGEQLGFDPTARTGRRGGKVRSEEPNGQPAASDAQISHKPALTGEGGQ
jgi:hypothetical protein